VAGPVQGPGSGFWPGHRVWPGRPGQFFFLKKKSKRCRFSKKKNKSQRVCHRVLTGSCRVTGSTRRVSRVTPGFSFPRFFINPARVGRGPGSTRRAGPGFKTMLLREEMIKTHNPRFKTHRLDSWTKIGQTSIKSSNYIDSLDWDPK
jgi:hypothetical protein